MIQKTGFLLFVLFFYIHISPAQKLVNPNATPEALKLKSFLDSVYGKKIISGHMNDVYYNYIVDATGGKAPAIMGYDFNGICPSQGGNSDATKAIKWVKEKGGIAQFQWHWISPDANGDFYTKNFKLADAFRHILLFLEKMKAWTFLIPRIGPISITPTRLTLL